MTRLEAIARVCSERMVAGPQVIVPTGYKPRPTSSKTIEPDSIKKWGEKYMIDDDIFVYMVDKTWKGVSKVDKKPYSTTKRYLNFEKQLASKPFHFNIDAALVVPLSVILSEMVKEFWKRDEADSQSQSLLNALDLVKK